MPRSLALRSLFCACVGSAAVASLVFACSDETTSPLPAQPEAGTPRQRDGGRTNGDTDEDAGDVEDASPNADASPRDATPPRDANGPGDVGATCAFNRDCRLALRCECDDFECVCKPGPRGTGRNGIDRCDSGDQCASSVCVEGPNGTDFYCSDECQGPADCTGALPRCVSVAGFPEPICVRQP